MHDTIALLLSIQYTIVSKPEILRRKPDDYITDLEIRAVGVVTFMIQYDRRCGQKEERYK